MTATNVGVEGVVKAAGTKSRAAAAAKGRKADDYRRKHAATRRWTEAGRRDGCFRAERIDRVRNPSR